MYDTMTDFIHPIEEEQNDLFMMNLNLPQQKSSPIRPPTPLTPSSNSIYSSAKFSPSYSLFDTNENFSSTNSTWDWLTTNQNKTPLLRKHSINADGNDFSNGSSPTSTATDFWRRTSEPNITSYSSLVCSSCLNNHTQLLPFSCGNHRFCNSCLTSQSLKLIMQGACPICAPTLSNNYNINNMHLATKTNNTIASPNEYVFQYQQQLNYSSQPSLQNSFHYPCAKISNIPWDVSQNDVRHFFSNCRSPSLSVYTQSIHIMMDRTTGKTLSDAYVEFTCVSDMRRAIETKNQKPLKGRIVSVNECSQEELLTVVFPKWRGQFHGTLAIPPASEVVRTMSTAAGGGNSGCPPFITREEINSLLVVCKNYKLHFSRKCAERPFENIITVIAKYPWHQPHLITTMHRDHIYEMLKLSIESLKTHLAKDYVQIDSTLLERLTRAGIMCPAFTERQKTTLLQTARIDCPADIESFLLVTNCIALSNSASPVIEQQQFQQSPMTINTKQNFPFLKRDPQEYQLNKVYPWEKSQSDDSSLSDLLLSPTHSPISSLIRDIHQTCYFDEQLDQKPKKSTLNQDFSMNNNGLPLLLQPITNLSQSSLEQHYQQKSEQRLHTNNLGKPVQQLSPWAPSYAPKTLSDDIWRISTPVESSSKSLLTA